MKQEQLQLTPEEELQATINKAKKKYGKIYKTVLADEVIIWRLLKRSEYKEIMNMYAYKEEEIDGEIKKVEDDEATFELRQEEIAKRVIVYPTDSDFVENMAAVADVISGECMVKSGFGDSHTEQC